MIFIEQESMIEQKCLQLLHQASEYEASDVHLLPREKNFKILFRKYGRFVQMGEFPNDLAARMISYFKFLSSLDISEKRKPQSGAFQKSIQNKNYSFRISTLPSTFHKESLAIRFLRQNFTRPIPTICHDPKSAETLTKLVEYPSGLLLISGATGSGKTTTLYSLLHYCAKELSRHVISLEDPVESTQEDLLQIQVNERAGVTYSAGLKAILRHSPEVIMVGEIRDKETAQIAMEAAFTGHLVISTIHAKDTVNCLYRLLDLSISVEDMRQMLLAIVTQSLVTTKTAEYKALFEVLMGEQLQNALQHVQEKRDYELPEECTIVGQLSRLEEQDYEYTNH
ncbi:MULTISPECIES: competence type IV pilus ATPase ComGA [unclassified Lysinibacillus]|uniref:competence type IV pilus ATPase ComGA n=1 Tax=unclassified Lysinibacillus TaxID=2636778 RepID=UPI001F0FFB18|nr:MULTISPECIES: competence type IV pilus ATPase ComGA [unclassified Lysinibacillus]